MEHGVVRHGWDMVHSERGSGLVSELQEHEIKRMLFTFIETFYELMYMLFSSLGLLAVLTWSSSTVTINVSTWCVYYILITTLSNLQT